MLRFDRYIVCNLQVSSSATITFGIRDIGLVIDLSTVIKFAILTFSNDSVQALDNARNMLGRTSDAFSHNCHAIFDSSGSFTLPELAQGVFEVAVASGTLLGLFDRPHARKIGAEWIYCAVVMNVTHEARKPIVQTVITEVSDVHVCLAVEGGKSRKHWKSDVECFRELVESMSGAI